MLRRLVSAPLNVAGWLTFFAGLAIGVYGLVSMAGLVNQIEALQASGAAGLINAQGAVAGELVIIALGAALTLLGYVVAVKSTAIKRIGR
jgi:hypothetical protein